MSNDAGRDKLFKRLERKRFPVEAQREIVNGIYPSGGLTPLRPVTGSKDAATKLIYSFGFSWKKAENLWQMLWGMSTDEYFKIPEPLPPLGPDERSVTHPRIMPPYPDACWASSSVVPRDSRCKSGGAPPLYAKTYFLLRSLPTEVWVCWDCYQRQTDRPDVELMEQFHRGEIEVLVPIRGPFRTARLSSLHGRD